MVHRALKASEELVGRRVCKEEVDIAEGEMAEDEVA